MASWFRKFCQLHIVTMASCISLCNLTVCSGWGLSRSISLDVSCVPVLGQGLVQLAPVVLLADGQQHGDHGEAADRQHVAEPGRAHARDVEEAQEHHRDQVVPDVEPAPDHPL